MGQGKSSGLVIPMGQGTEILAHIQVEPGAIYKINKDMLIMLFISLMNISWF